jgi:hypothetical protein
MIVTIDIEQNIEFALKKNNFFFGTIYAKDGAISKTIFNKKEFWQELINLGIKEAKQAKNLYVYAHHHYFDFQQYADLNDVNNVYRTITPFIFEREFSKKEKEQNNIKSNNKIYFLDSFALCNNTLQKVGQLINCEKQEWDFEDVKLIKKIELDLINKIETNNTKKYIEYNIQDARVVYEFIKYLKTQLKSIGFMPKRLMTITLLSRNYYLQEIKKLEEQGFFGQLIEKVDKNGKKHLTSLIFRNRIKNEFYKPPETILKRQTIAGRGGRFEAFKLGEFKDCAKIDLNSAYTKAMNSIRFPNLRTLKGLVYNPDEYLQEKYLDKIGIAFVHLYKKSKSKIGLIPIRYNFEGQNHQVFPNCDDLNIIGSYTHQEINYFIKNGFTLKKVFYTIYYENELLNPLPLINKKLFSLRKKNEFWNFFAKAIMNYFTGSLKQHREYLEKRYDYREHIDKYKKLGFKAVRGFGGKFLYEKGKGNKIYSKSFAGQIYADITANIRIQMTDLLKQVGEENIIYVPCDSVILKQDCFNKIKNKIDINDSIGSFKIEHQKAKGYIISKQQYYINEDIKMSGITKKDIQKNKQQIFNQETITTKKMVSMFKDIENAGSFITEQRNFELSQEKAQKLIDQVKEKSFFIDEQDLKENRKIIIKYLTELDKNES